LQGIFHHKGSSLPHFMSNIFYNLISSSLFL
jgi:hypothetical protein